MKRIGTLVATACLALSVTACTDDDSPAAGPASSPAMAPENYSRTVAIYSALIRDLFSTKPAFGGPLAFKRVWVVDAHVVLSGGGRFAPGSVEPFSEELQADLRRALVELLPLDFVDAAEAAPPVRGRLVRDRGAVLALGEIEGIGGEVHVNHHLTCGPKCGRAWAYVLKPRGDTWIVTGTTGQHMVS